MSDFHLFISSTDSVDVRKNNDPSEFWIQFPKAYALEGDWECAIKEISVTLDFKPRSKRLYLCSDLVDESYVKNSLRPILGNIEVQNRYKKLKSVEYLQPIYVKLRTNHFQSIRVYLIDENLRPILFESNDLHCILHLRKRWAQ